MVQQAALKVMLKLQLLDLFIKGFVAKGVLRSAVGADRVGIHIFQTVSRLRDREIPR